MPSAFGGEPDEVERTSIKTSTVNYDSRNNTTVISRAGDKIGCPAPASHASVAREQGRLEMDVGTWLGSLGLDQYEDLFRQHEIDADILPELTDQHLRDIGIPLGHRLRMLRAIRQFANDGDPDSP
jgi:hypothetical protein